MPKVFFTADLHFYHVNIIKYSNRPFASVEEMNEVLVSNWNTIVGENDTVYVLGDFSLAVRPVETFLPRLNGRKKLIMGNHDFPHPSHPKAKKPENQAKWKQKYFDYGFESIELNGTFEIPGVATFNLNHIPYAESYLDNDSRRIKVHKYAAFDNGLPLLHGHVHNTFLTSRAPSGSIMINVGVDAPGAPWSGQFRPATLEEISEVYLKESQK